MSNKFMPRQKKVTKQQSDADWLQSEPEPTEVEIAPNTGGYHIPIDQLRPLLDRLNGTTRNYKSMIFKDGYANQTAFGSIELTVLIDGVERTVTGAYNMPIQDAINGFWNGTLKSECIKNAAIDLGKRFGRGLNAQEPTPAKAIQVGNEVIVELHKKAIPDAKILSQYKAALERGDEAALATLRNIYIIKNEQDVQSKTSG